MALYLQKCVNYIDVSYINYVFLYPMTIFKFLFLLYDKKIFQILKNILFFGIF
jgi:hypothetical protein